MKYTMVDKETCPCCGSEFYLDEYGEGICHTCGEWWDRESLDDPMAKDFCDEQ